MTKESKKKIIGWIADIIWMARRYADGRMTYASGTFNESQAGLVSELGEEVMGKPDSVVQSFPKASWGIIEVPKATLRITEREADLIRKWGQACDAEFNNFSLQKDEPFGYIGENNELLDKIISFIKQHERNDN